MPFLLDFFEIPEERVVLVKPSFDGSQSASGGSRQDGNRFAVFGDDNPFAAVGRAVHKLGEPCLGLRYADFIPHEIIIVKIV